MYHNVARVMLHFGITIGVARGKAVTGEDVLPFWWRTDVQGIKSKSAILPAGALATVSSVDIEHEQRRVGRALQPEEFAFLE